MDCGLLVGGADRVDRDQSAIERGAAPLITPTREAFILTLAAGTMSDPDESIIFGGEEIVYGQKGRLCFKIRGQKYLLRPGNVRASVPSRAPCP